MFLINTNRLFYIIFNIINNFLELALKKNLIIGKDYKEKIFDYIEPYNLPNFLGEIWRCEHIPRGCLYTDIGPWNPKGKRYNFHGEKVDS